MLIEPEVAAVRSEVLQKSKRGHACCRQGGPAQEPFHVFEMPLLGYIGYIPFSWELFALYHLIVGSLRGEAAIVQLWAR